MESSLCSLSPGRSPDLEKNKDKCEFTRIESRAREEWNKDIGGPYKFILIRSYLCNAIGGYILSICVYIGVVLAKHPTLTKATTKSADAINEQKYPT